MYIIKHKKIIKYLKVSLPDQAKDLYPEKYKMPNERNQS